MTSPTPKALGYSFPAEFAPHHATWLSWPHKEASWPGKIETIYPVYAQFIKLVSEGEFVNINVADEAMKQKALRFVQENVRILLRLDLEIDQFAADFDVIRIRIGFRSEHRDLTVNGHHAFGYQFFRSPARSEPGLSY